MSSGANRLLLSVVIPAHNEEENLEPTVAELSQVLSANRLAYEIVIVNDNSIDRTQEVAEKLAEADPDIRVLERARLPGFGRAIRAGLAAAGGDILVIMMADRSDDPADVVRYYRKIEDGYDCVFGSRFRKGSKLERYPRVKLLFNRLVNKLIQLIFLTRFNDLTNAFKAYRRDVVHECGPFASSHFNITIEMEVTGQRLLLSMDSSTGHGGRFRLRDGRAHQRGASPSPHRRGHAVKRRAQPGSTGGVRAFG